jgi:predicted amidohydrolase YtcJ
VILRNGTIRTLDPSLPTVAALWIAGDRIAGGVGVHETALPSPDTVDLGGRCVLPGFTDSHVHFPTWALSQNDVQLHGCASLAEALDRVRAAPRTGTWLRGQGWRDADWPDGPPTRQALDEIVSDRPAMLISKDYHALWLNSAALSLAGGDLEVDGGVVVKDPADEPTGVLYEEAAWRFKGRFVQVPAEEYVEAMRSAVKIAASRGVTALHDKDGWLGAIGLWQRLEEQGALPQRIWQSTPAERVGDLRDIGLRSGVGSPLVRLGYLKTFMDGTLGSQTAWMTDGSGVVITSSEQLEEIVRAGAAAGWPVGVHAIGDAANKATRGSRSASGSGSSTHSALRRRTSRGSPSSGSQSPSSSRTRPPTRSSPSATGPTGSTGRTRSARCSTRARCSRTAPTHRWRSSSRGPACSPPCSTTGARTSG